MNDLDSYQYHQLTGQAECYIHTHPERINYTYPHGAFSDTAQQLKDLSYKAQRYRSGMASNTPEAIANALFTQIAKDLRANDVSIADIARAAGVTHRAISRCKDE